MLRSVRPSVRLCPLLNNGAFLVDRRLMFCSFTFFYFFISTQVVIFRLSTDRHEIFTHNLRWGRADDLRFEVLIFDPQKMWRGKTPKFRQILPNDRQLEIRNFEMAQHIDKRIADLSSAINVLKDGTKFGGTPNQF